MEGQIISQIEDDDAEDELWEDDCFEWCDRCDMPDACADYGCAIKLGVRKYEGWDY